MHAFLVGPQNYYLDNTPTEDLTTGGLCGIYVVTTSLMFSAQCFWIAMALRTPPGGAGAVLEAKDEQEEATDKNSEDYCV